MKKLITIAALMIAIATTNSNAFGEYTIQFIGSNQTYGYFVNYTACAQYLQQWTSSGGRGGMCVMAN